MGSLRAVCDPVRENAVPCPAAVLSYLSFWPLPLTGKLEADALVRVEQKRQFGVDLLDIEGMLAISYPKP